MNRTDALAIAAAFLILAILWAIGRTQSAGPQATHYRVIGTFAAIFLAFVLSALLWLIMKAIAG